MKFLVIAEKPSVARSISKVIGALKNILKLAIIISSMIRL